MGRYVATKTYDHNEGLTCAYRVHRASSKSNLLHGHALNIKMIFECTELDADTGQVIDLNELSTIENWLHETFDHTVCIDKEDPALELFEQLHLSSAINLKIMDGVGCEKFAELVWNYVGQWLRDAGLAWRVNIRTIEVRENQADSKLFLF